MSGAVPASSETVPPTTGRRPGDASKDGGRPVRAAGGPASPSVHLDTPNLSPRERFEAWRAYNDGVYDFVRAGQNPCLLVPMAWARRVGNIVASEVATPAQHFRREGGMLKSSEDQLLLRWNRRGAVRGVLDGEPFEVRPGEIHVFDWMRPLYGVGDAAAGRGVAVPYAALGYEPRQHPARFDLRTGSPAGRLMATALETLFEQAPYASGEDADALARGFAGLLRGVLLPATADDAARSAVERNRAAALRRYVDAHFADPTISAAAVGRAVGASRATVYRVFAPEGGFERAVLDRRLRAAVSELSQAAPRRGAIASVAARWGFDEPCRFARLCRKRFAYSPSDILGFATPADRETAPGPLPRPVEVAVPRLRQLFE